MRSLSLSFVVVALLTWSCGKEEEDEIVLGPDPTGTWVQSCGGGSMKSVNSYVYAGSSLVNVTQSYSAEGCTAGTETLTLRMKGSYERVKNKPDANGAYPLNWAVTDVTAAPSTAEFAAASNTTATCGATDWAVGVEKTVVGCALFASITTFVGQTKGSYYKITGTKLQFTSQTTGVLSSEAEAYVKQ